MAFRPSVLVTSPDMPKTLMIVEIQAGSGGAQADDVALRAYMVRRNCPVGMLVTSERARFYRNRYTSDGPESVLLKGECSTAELLGIRDGRLSDEQELERLVQDWLEDVQVTLSGSWPDDARDAIESSLIPVLAGGIVGAAGPRWLRAG